MKKVLVLRIVHGLFAIYFILCLIYVYFAALFSRIDIFLFISVLSLGVEGFIVFILNKGDCPLIHIQRRVGDNTPFFNLFLPSQLAKQAIPLFAKLTWIGVGMVVIRILLIYY